MLRAAPAIGAVATALVIAHYPLRRKVGATMLVVRGAGSA